MSEAPSDGSGPGGDSAPSESPRPRVVAEERPAEVAELARACIGYVDRALGVELDFAPETLPVLDHYITAQREALRERPELLTLMARVVGAYFGEVLCQHLDLFWRIPSPDAHTWQLCGRSVLLALSPVGLAYDALWGGDDHDGPSSDLRLARDEEEAVRLRLERLPPISEEEYHLLSTRLEGLEIVVEALRGQALAVGASPVEFELEDYTEDPTFNPR